MAYIAFSVLCVMNIVTGVFVENCNKMTARDEDLVHMEQLEQRRQWYEEVKQMFESACQDSGCLSVKQFSDKLAEDVRLRAWMQKIGVQVESHSVSGLFQILDLDGDGQLDFDEFAIALQQVHGQARSIDVAKILHDTKLLRRLLLLLIEKVSPDLYKENKMVARARSKSNADPLAVYPSSDGVSTGSPDDDMMLS
mmetsp:Transcript_27340/g.51623  ORF Transcript_27340/g.51623 Transcript_27340/m.51623 type:complete len:196 (-) Transcript_27340:45-632(-)